MIIEFFEEEITKEIVQKNINLCRNGSKDHSPFISFQLAPDMQMGQIKRLIESKYDNKHFITHLRLFNQDGVEVFAEDFQFLKSNTTLYASFHGEEFDSNSEFSQYEIIKKLGEGGFGKVLLGQHRITKQKVAIKIVNTASIGNAEDIDMVFREAEMLKSLVHQNIVKIYNCYTLPNMSVVFVMEYLEGGELLQYVQQKGRLTEIEARTIFIQIADAIYYCHNQSLIHRDLKLENILLAQKNKTIVKIVDFGIAGLATNFDVSKIDAGSLKYMAPEIFSKKIKKIGPHIDIWALGVILFGMITGQLPFDGENQNEIIAAIQNQNFNLPKDFSVSNELKDLIQKIFNPDFLHRIKLSEVLAHPWCTDSEIAKKATNRVVINPIARNSLGAGKSRMSLAAGQSKLNNGKLGAGISFIGSLKISLIKQQQQQLQIQQNQNLLLQPQINQEKSAFSEEIESPIKQKKQEYQDPYVPNDYKQLLAKIKGELNVSPSPKSRFKVEFEESQQKPPKIIIQTEQLISEEEKQIKTEIKTLTFPSIENRKNQSPDTPTMKNQKLFSQFVTKDYNKIVDKFKIEVKKSGIDFKGLKKEINDKLDFVLPKNPIKIKKVIRESFPGIKLKSSEIQSINVSQNEFQNLQLNRSSSMYDLDKNQQKFLKMHQDSLAQQNDLILKNRVRIGFYQRADFRVGKKFSPLKKKHLRTQSQTVLTSMIA